MKSYISATLLSLLLPLAAGCAYHPSPVTVYGRSGTAYTAPTLCAAEVQCLNSKEESCFYDRTTMTTPQTGTQEEAGCKEIKK
jgi:hypothetical protein